MAELILEVYNSNNNHVSIVFEDLDTLVALDEEKIKDLLLAETEAETESDAEIEADALHFLSEAALGVLDYQVEAGLISQIEYIKTKAFFESDDPLTYEISIVESDDFDADDKALIDEAEAELEAEEVSITEAISNIIDEMSLVQEVVYHKVIRHGVVKKLLVCPPGYKRVDNRCMKMASGEVRKRAKAALKANRTKKREFASSAFRNLLLKKRNKSLRVRKQKGLR